MPRASSRRREGRETAGIAPLVRPVTDPGGTPASPEAPADVVDIESLARLVDRQKSGQAAAQYVMLFGMLVVAMRLGGRTALAMLLLFVLLSVSMLRGRRWAAIVLFALSLSMLVAMVAALGHEAFVREPPPVTRGASGPARGGLTRWLFHAGAAGGLIAGFYLVRALRASVARGRILPPPPLDLLVRMRGAGRALARLAGRWQPWAWAAVVALSVALVAPGPLLFFVDLALHGRAGRTARLMEHPPLAALFGTADLSGWLQVTVYAIAVMGLVGVVVTAFARIRRHLADSSAEALRGDPRPPLLLLRSFADDAVTVWPSQGLLLTRAGNTLEHTLERELRAYGPVVAVGRPGERLPPLGAAREYLADDTWRERVGELTSRARLVVVVMGKSEGLVLEYDQLAALDAIGKVMLVIPPEGAAELRERWECFVRHALRGRPVAPPRLEAAIVALFPAEGRPTYVVHRERRAAADHYSLGVQVALRRRLAPPPPAR